MNFQDLLPGPGCYTMSIYFFLYLTIRKNDSLSLKNFYLSMPDEQWENYFSSLSTYDKSMCFAMSLAINR